MRGGLQCSSHRPSARSRTASSRVPDIRSSPIPRRTACRQEGLFMESQPVAIRTTTSVENGHVQEVVRRSHEELRQLLQQRAEVMRRIRTIKRIIDGLANLFGDMVLSEKLLELAGRKSNGRQTGFTKACQEVVRRAHEELRQLLQQRAEVMRRIRTIKRTIDGLATLFGDVVLSEELPELAGSKSNGRQTGFTKACRMILMDANRALSARDVCDRIQEKLPPMLERHKDPMASVRTC